MPQFSVSSRPAGRLLSLVLALLMAVALLTGPALAADTSGEAEALPQVVEDISLALTEAHVEGYDDGLFYLLVGEQYYLTLDGELLVTADSEEALVRLVQTAAAAYVTEDTVSCALTDPEQVGLYYGYVTFGASDDLEAAAQTLAQELSVTTVEETVREETVPYEEITQEDPDMYVDEEPVVTEGSEGLNRVTEQSTYVNGELSLTRTLDTEVVTEPVDQVTVVGTKEHYIWPASGRVSSKFGPRNISGGSKNHKGIDIAVSYGSDIVAAKSGTVIYAQYNSSGYGYLVKIQHEDGDVTYYAHNSSLTVSVGDVVAQGDVIAKAGSTGNSTGTHCHFEIRKNGTTPVDPLDYLES